MGKREDLQAQIEALQAELDGADDDVELWVEHERNGKAVKTKLSGGHAKSWLDDLLGTPAGSGQGDDDGGDDDGQGDELPEKKPSGGGYFGKRKG